MSLVYQFFLEHGVYTVDTCETSRTDGCRDGHTHTQTDR